LTGRERGKGAAMRARKAIVLAAGLGTRLRPLDAAVPKPLMPVWGVPMIARIVDTLRNWGVADIAVNCHHLADKTEAWCRGNGCFASREPEILGTGGAINPLRGWLGGEPFYLVNGDVIAEGIDECPFGDAEFGKDEIARCLVSESGPRTIEVEPSSGFVTCWKSQDAGLPGTYTYCGMALLSPRIAEFVAPAGYSTIVEAYGKAMEAGKFVKALRPEGFLWADAGTVDSYIEVNTSGDDNAYGSFPQLEAYAATRKDGGAAEKVEFLGARGSDRCFFRQGRAVVVAYDDAKRRENARYAGHARWLKGKGAPVPEVLADLPGDKTLALEWAGAPRDMTPQEYARAVEALARFNALGAEPDLPELEEPFGPALWKWERDLFAKHCLGERYGMELSAGAEAELVRAAETLDREPPALVHRDFQKSNILWRNGEMFFIDFQGMRRGPASYDLASLLYDPYAKLDARMRRALAELYAKTSGSRAAAENLAVAGTERLVQALGAFGRLAAAGHPEFGKHVPAALQNLLAAADEAGFDALGALAEELIAKEGKRAEAAHGHGHECGGHGHGGDCACGCGGTAR